MHAEEALVKRGTLEKNGCSQSSAESSTEEKALPFTVSQN